MFSRKAAGSRARYVDVLNPGGRRHPTPHPGSPVRTTPRRSSGCRRGRAGPRGARPGAPGVKLCRCAPCFGPSTPPSGRPPGRRAFAL
ncbi:protein transport protein Sec16A-like [Pteropus vampyrus]|uniref:Protein transport protein Sec16A-like n=1 Tax=Pteropus vampyrus TaxID=132908 RepID=A0A6P6CZ54_PTEVA|nr:protein transport protein Sec16A-like [Pteropus vampyrus]